MNVLDALIATGQVILPIALAFGGYVAGYMHGSITGITTILTARKGKK